MSAIEDEVLEECRNCGEDDCHERCPLCSSLLCGCGTCRDARLCDCIAGDEERE